MGMYIPKDIDERFLKTLINMWEDPEKKKLLVAEGTDQKMIDDAKEKLKMINGEQ